MDWNGIEIPDNPYYQDEWVVIYHGDCREILPELPKVDLMLTDPPYLVGRFDDGREDYKDFCRGWFNLAMSKSDCLIFTPGLSNMGIYYKLCEPLWVACWRVTNGCSHTPIGGFVGWEPIMIYGKPPKTAGRDVFEVPITLRYDFGIDKHDFPKPEDLMTRLVLEFSNPDSLIVDFFAGTGTTLFASKKTNRKCIGIEIEEKYCEIVAKRCCQRVMELKWD